MATIDRDKLIADIKLYLPLNNVLTDEEMLVLAEQLIAKIGDDDVNTPEVQCKLLGNIADVNHAKYITTGASLKRQKVRLHEQEYTSNNSNIWKDYKKSLSDICPIFGYYPKYVRGARVNSSEMMNTSTVISSCNCDVDFF